MAYIMFHASRATVLRTWAWIVALGLASLGAWRPAVVWGGGPPSLGSSGSAKATVANGANGQSGSPSPPLLEGQVGSGSFQMPTVAGDFGGGFTRFWRIR